MSTWKLLTVSLVLFCAPARAQEQTTKAAPRRAGDGAAREPLLSPKVAPSRVTAVTVYQGNALVTRQVDVPEGRGWSRSSSRLCPLKRSTARSTPREPTACASSAPGTARAPSRRTPARRFAPRKPRSGARARGRAAQEGSAGHRAKSPVAHQARELHRRDHAASGRERAAQQRGDADAGQVRDDDPGRESRRPRSPCSRSCRPTPRRPQFATRELAELTSGSSRTERDAVIVVDRAAPAGKVRLNYLVTAATWRPQYRFRARPRTTRSSSNTWRPSSNRSGEDWTGVDMTLSTAQPQLNATPPDLLRSDIHVVGRTVLAGSAAGPARQSGMAQGSMGG